MIQLVFNCQLLNYPSLFLSQRERKSGNQETASEIALETTPIKVNSASHVNPQLMSDARRTRSALPLLKTSVRFSKGSVSGSAATPAHTAANSSMSIEQIRSSMAEQENQLTVNLNNCFNAQSYKLVNAPVSGGGTRSTPLAAAKGKLIHSANVLMDKASRVRENTTVNKTL